MWTEPFSNTLLQAAREIGNKWGKGKSWNMQFKSCWNKENVGHGNTKNCRCWNLEHNTKWWRNSASQAASVEDYVLGWDPSVWFSDAIFVLDPTSDWIVWGRIPTQNVVCPFPLQACWVPPEPFVCQKLCLISFSGTLSGHGIMNTWYRRNTPAYTCWMSDVSSRATGFHSIFRAGFTTLGTV